MKKCLISIITSEKTWKNFSKFGFHEKILKNREEFDLAIVLNGYNVEAVKFYKQFTPEYFFLRENVGFDPAAIKHLLMLIPVYNNTLILHDDHWFETDEWLIRIRELINKYPEVDIWGNILYNDPLNGHLKLYKLLGLEKLNNFNYVDYLNGMSGLFNRNAIEKMKTFLLPDSLLLYGDKTNANIGERIFSNIAFFMGLKLVQFPPGLYKFLMHGGGNEKNYLFSTANMFLYQKQFAKAKEFYYKYYDYCLNIGYTKDFFVLFNNLAVTHYYLGEYSEVKRIINICEKNHLDCLIAKNKKFQNLK